MFDRISAALGGSGEGYKPEGVQYEVSIDDAKGVRYDEIFYPWDTIRPLQPKAGGEFAFSTMYWDRDEQGSYPWTGRYCWFFGQSHGSMDLKNDFARFQVIEVK